MHELQETLRQLLEDVPGLELTILFGSRAREQAVHSSDADLAIQGQNVDIFALAARLSMALGCEVDVVRLEEASIPLLEQMIQDGIVVQERPHGRGALWRSRTLATLATDRPWFRRMRDAWIQRVAEVGFADGQ